MLTSKRRSASTQAVNQRLKGMSPVINTTGRTTLSIQRKSTRAQPEKQGCVRSLGVEDHGMCDSKTTRQPGRPCSCFPGVDGEYGKQPHKGRESKQRQGVGSSNSTNEGE